MAEKHSSLEHLKTTMRSEGDVNREIYFLLSLSGNVEVDQIREFFKVYYKEMPTSLSAIKNVLSISLTSTPSEKIFLLLV